MSPSFWFVTVMVGLAVCVAGAIMEDDVAFQIVLLWSLLGIGIIGTIDLLGRKQ